MATCGLGRRGWWGRWGLQNKSREEQEKRERENERGEEDREKREIEERDSIGDRVRGTSLHRVALFAQPRRHGRGKKKR